MTDPLPTYCQEEMDSKVVDKSLEMEAWRAKGRAVSAANRSARLERGLPAVMTPFERLAEKPTLARAIAAKCWDCQGQDADPYVKWRIGNCEVGEACPLYAFRPYREKLGQPEPGSPIVGV